MDDLKFFYSYFRFEYIYESKFPSTSFNDRLNIIKIYKLIGIEIKKRVFQVSYSKDPNNNETQYKKVNQI